MIWRWVGGDKVSLRFKSRQICCGLFLSFTSDKVKNFVCQSSQVQIILLAFLIILIILPGASWKFCGFIPSSLPCYQRLVRPKTWKHTQCYLKTALCVCNGVMWVNRLWSCEHVCKSELAWIRLMKILWFKLWVSLLSLKIEIAGCSEILLISHVLYGAVGFGLLKCH
jgi:hypothetical protein